MKIIVILRPFNTRVQFESLNDLGLNKVTPARLQVNKKHSKYLIKVQAVHLILLPLAVWGSHKIKHSLDSVGNPRSITSTVLCLFAFILMNLDALMTQSAHQWPNTCASTKQAATTRPWWHLARCLHVPVVTVCLLRCRVNNINTVGAGISLSDHPSSVTTTCSKHQKQTEIAGAPVVPCRFYKCDRTWKIKNKMPSPPC